MSAEISSAVNSPTFAEQQELKMAVAELFSVFQRKYGPRWRDRFEDPAARPTWFASLRAAGVTAAMVKRGLAKLSVPGARAPGNAGWPPSDEEFIELCVLSAPTVDTALREAQAWSRAASHEFSHAAIGAAARSVGQWSLRSLDERELRRVFGAAYATALQRLARGESLDMPIPRALPAEIGTPIPLGAEPAHITEQRVKLARQLGLAP
ncbi:hypothetical protein EAH75_04220 [Rhodanobacter glycinis]|uniref:replication protein P n=1 Tax=Rhodanobacter glycinis TaxID=582702 RepID=UPI001129EE09|nr:replication protein P [Rhodanobacter glycinis]TPG50650.1 hypothetical protein EAH75_04220 [Rhodanobacter glycinis]